MKPPASVKESMKTHRPHVIAGMASIAFAADRLPAPGLELQRGRNGLSSKLALERLRP